MDDGNPWEPVARAVLEEIDRVIDQRLRKFGLRFKKWFEEIVTPPIRDTWHDELADFVRETYDNGLEIAEHSIADIAQLIEEEIAPSRGPNLEPDFITADTGAAPTPHLNTLVDNGHVASVMQRGPAPAGLAPAMTQADDLVDHHTPASIEKGSAPVGLSPGIVPLTDKAVPAPNWDQGTGELQHSINTLQVHIQPKEGVTLEIVRKDIDSQLRNFTQFNGGANTVATVEVDPETNVATFTSLGLLGLLSSTINDEPVEVQLSYDPAKHEVTAVTLDNHQLVGVRKWRVEVEQLEDGTILATVTTESYDRPRTGRDEFGFELAGAAEQLKVWAQYLANIARYLTKTYNAQVVAPETIKGARAFLGLVPNPWARGPTHPCACPFAGAIIADLLSSGTLPGPQAHADWRSISPSVISIWNPQPNWAGRQALSRRRSLSAPCRAIWIHMPTRGVSPRTSMTSRCAFKRIRLTRLRCARCGKSSRAIRRLRA